jgi:hypothetical protein
MFKKDRDSIPLLGLVRIYDGLTSGTVPTPLHILRLPAPPVILIPLNHVIIHSNIGKVVLVGRQFLDLPSIIKII